MDRLEALIHDALAEHAAVAPTMLPAVRPARRPHRTWWAVAATAAAVIAVVAAVTAVQSSRDGSHPSGPAPQLAAPTNSSRTTPAAARPDVPAGYKLVSYRGIEVAVPRRLQVTHSPCFPPVNAVFAPNGAAYSCPAPALNGSGRTLPATATAVWLGTAPDGRVATTHEPTSHRTVAGVRVSATAPRQAEVDKILNSIRAVTVDRLGCPTHPASLTPSGQPDSARLVPSGATSVVVCELSPNADDQPPSLDGSYRLPSASVAPLAAALDALPAGTARSGFDANLYDWIVFHYPGGTTRTIVAPTDIEPANLSDGQHSVIDAMPGLDLLPLLQH